MKYLERSGAGKVWLHHSFTRSL